jgi:hypothetical protein
MTKHVLRALAVIGTATLAAGLTAAPAGAADTKSTITTFELTGGDLSISVPADAKLGSVATGTAFVSGQLGPVKVTDNRGAVLATWTTTVASSDFKTGEGSPEEIVSKANVLYTPGAPTAQSPAASVFVPTADSGLLDVDLPAYLAVTTGNNSVTWNPTVRIALPAQAVAGTYTGTITHSVS